MPREIHMDFDENGKLNRTVKELKLSAMPIKQVRVGKIVSDGTLEGTMVYDSEGNWISNVKAFKYEMDVDSIFPKITVELVDVQLEYMPTLKTTKKEAVYVFPSASPVMFRKYAPPKWLMKIWNFFGLLNRETTKIFTNGEFTTATMKEHMDDFKVHVDGHEECRCIPEKAYYEMGSKDPLLVIKDKENE